MPVKGYSVYSVIRSAKGLYRSYYRRYLPVGYGGFRYCVQLDIPKIQDLHRLPFFDILRKARGGVGMIAAESITYAARRETAGVHLRRERKTLHFLRTGIVIKTRHPVRRTRMTRGTRRSPGIRNGRFRKRLYARLLQRAIDRSVDRRGQEYEHQHGGYDYYRRQTEVFQHAQQTRRFGRALRSFVHVVCR